MNKDAKIERAIYTAALLIWSAIMSHALATCSGHL
jgi:hypothetical protein